MIARGAALVLLVCGCSPCVDLPRSVTAACRVELASRRCETADMLTPNGPCGRFPCGADGFCYVQSCTRDGDCTHGNCNRATLPRGYCSFYDFE